eukprot:Skav234803  [mRNA]  locus=scaffold69:410009:411256:+ [translate_table: standard]
MTKLQNKGPLLLSPKAPLGLVFYECRSLERRFQTTRLPLVPSGSGARDVALQEQRRRSDDTQLETLEESYWEKASKDGNREPHYRRVAESPYPGSTLVWDFGKLEIEAVQKLLKDSSLQVFRQEVTQALPGYYVFFDEGALHVPGRSRRMGVSQAIGNPNHPSNICFQ